MKKWLSMFLAAVMLCGVLAGCGGTQSGSTPASGAQSASAAGDSNVNAEGFPIVNEPITLRGMVALNANVKDWNEHPALVPFPVSWTVKMKKKQKETQDILSYHTQAAGCSDKARAKASGGRQPIEECGRTGL